MSDDEGGKKDNTSPEHKPKNAVRHDKAPSGSMGAQYLTPPGLGGGKAPQKSVSQAVETTAQKAQSEPEKDNRELFRKTGDKEVDADAIKQGYKMQPNPPLDFNKAAAQEERAQQLAKKFKKDKDQDKSLGL
ncbi:hypothetical protein [Stappia sp. ICDLI1TA098]